MQFVLATQNTEIGGFDNFPPPENHTARPSTLSSYQAATILSNFQDSENVVTALTHILSLLQSSQGPDGGFHAKPQAAPFEYLHTPSPAASTAQGLYIADLLRKFGLVSSWPLSWSPYSSAKAYLASCVAIIPFYPTGILSDAPWGGPTLEATYYWMVYDSAFSFVYPIPVWLKHLVAGIGGFLITVALIQWFKPQVPQGFYLAFSETHSS